MSVGLYSHNTRATGTVLTATIYNGDHVNHITNQNPLQTGAYSDNAAQMQTMTNPGSVGSESLAPHLAGELERLRFKINDLALYLGLTAAQWYSTFTGTVSASKVAAPVLATITGPITLTVADANTIKNVTAVADITLPAVSALATGNTIKFKSSTEQKVRLLPQGSDTVDGDTEYLLPSYTTCEVMVSGAGTFILTMKPDYVVGMLYPNMVVGNVAPRGFLFPDGAARNRVTYGGLFYASTLTGTVTITIATPGVVTWPANKLQNNDPIEFSTTGALPTGLVAGTTYYVTNNGVDGAGKFRVAATPGGADIATSGGQSGVHTALHVPYGRGDGSTTFNVADVRGRAPHGRDALGGTAASRVTAGISGINGDTPGASGGDERLHTHNHGVTDPTHVHQEQYTSTGSTAVAAKLSSTSGGGGTIQPAGLFALDLGPLNTVAAGTGITINNAGAGSSQNMSPMQVTSWLVKT